MNQHDKKVLLTDIMQDLCEMEEADFDSERSVCVDYDCFYNKVEARIAAVQNEWISVEDRLPEEDGFYIVAFRTGGKYFSHFNNGIFRNVHSHQEYGVTAFGDDLTVTYWMPLPQPPER